MPALNKKKFVVGFLTALAVFFFSGSQVKAQVVINELLPNPSGEEKTGEWVEIFNLGDSSLDLAGFILEDAADHQLMIGLEL